MSINDRLRAYVIGFLAVMLLACQIGPRAPTPATQYALQPILTETPLPVLPTTTPTPRIDRPLSTPSPPATALPRSPVPTPPPPLPDGGDLPALWIDLDSGLASGDLYFPASLAHDHESGLLYVLGQCPRKGLYVESEPLACLSKFDLETDRVTAQTQIAASYTGKLVLSRDTLYLNQQWSGDLLAIDAETLHVREVISDVLQVAFDGQETVYAATGDGVLRLVPDRLVRPLSFAQNGSSVSLIDMAATQDRVYVLGYEHLWILSSELVPLATISLNDIGPRDMVLGTEWLYIGSYKGLYALDLESEQLGPVPAGIQAVEKLAFDADSDRLYALARHPYDWFGGSNALAVDVTTWQTQTLFATLEGWLPDLTIDAAQDRLLIVSSDDHALIPIRLSSGEIGPRLPLGIQVMDVIADEQANRLYVSNSTGWIQVLDRTTYQEIDRIYGGRHISLDASHSRLYAGDPRAPVVTVIGTKSLTLLREIYQPGTPRANSVTGQVVIVNRRFHVFDGQTGERHPELLSGIGIPPETLPGGFYTVAREIVIDARRGYTAALTYTPWPGKPGPLESIAYDPVSGRAYYALLTGGYIHHSSISAYADLRALQRNALADPESARLTLEGLSGYITLDTAAQLLYVARRHILYVLDSETLNRIGEVHTDGWLPRIAAVDGKLGRLYTPHDSSLAVWSRTGGAPVAPLPHDTVVLTKTIASILPSPNFAQDHTLLATLDGRLCRSTDGGQTWHRLRGGLPEHGPYVTTVKAAFSPSYVTDMTLWAGVFVGDSHGEGVWRSTDGGDTWHLRSDGLYDLRVYRVFPSPRYAKDKTLLAYAHSKDGDVLYQSTNAGATWQLVVRQTGYNQPPLPRPEELFGAEQYAPKFQCNYDGTCQRSDDGGRTWDPFETGVIVLDRLVDVAISPQPGEQDRHAQVVYFLTESDLYRTRLDTSAWQRCKLPFFANRDDYPRHLTALATAMTSASAYDVFIGSANGEFFRFSPDPATDGDLTWETIHPVPSATRELPTSAPCTGPIDDRLSVDYANLPPQLGCAEEAGAATLVAFQPFEHGMMLWRQDKQEIYVLYDDSTWVAFEDTWDPSQPDRDPSLLPPASLYQPVHGFGKVWREQLGGAAANIGWATNTEYSYDTIVQVFSHGLLLRGEGNVLYVLYNDGIWETSSSTV